MGGANKWFVALAALAAAAGSSQTVAQDSAARDAANASKKRRPRTHLTVMTRAGIVLRCTRPA
jgi:hypothetical protein